MFKMVQSPKYILNLNNYQRFKPLEEQILICYLYLLYLLIIGTLEERLQIYEEVSKRHPRAVSPRRLPLNFVSGNTLHICSIIIFFCFFLLIFGRLLDVHLIATFACTQIRQMLFFFFSGLDKSICYVLGFDRKSSHTLIWWYNYVMLFSLMKLQDRIVSSYFVNDCILLFSIINLKSIN